MNNDTALEHSACGDGAGGGVFPFFAREVFPALGAVKSARFFLLAHARGNSFARWLDFLNCDLAACLDDATKIRLAQRVVRPYMRPWLNAAERAGMLADHYAILLQRFPAAAVRSILQQPPATLATLAGKSGRSHLITMGVETTKEGELCFSFIDGGAVLAQLRGTMGFDEAQRPVFWIGGLQGAKPPLGRDEIVAATRDLNGLRPKHAVLQAACAFTQWIGADRLIAPAGDHHVSQRGWRKWSFKRKIHADYNAFWEEFGATPLPGGDYCIALPLPRRDAADIPSKRRKEWTSRYKQVDAIAAATAATLHSLAEGSCP